jgi:hypothetical protein
VIRRSSLFWDLTQRTVVIPYRRFGINLSPQLQRSNSPRNSPRTLRLRPGIQIFLSVRVRENQAEEQSWRFHLYPISSSSVFVSLCSQWKHQSDGMKTNLNKNKYDKFNSSWTNMQNFKAGKIVSPILVSRITTPNTMVAENQNKGTARYSKQSAQHFCLILTNFVFLDRSS